MKEIYRSFDGKLDVDNQSGYIVYEGNGFYEIESFSVWRSGSKRVRLKAPVDWTDLAAIGEATLGVEHGVVEGQAFYKGKWYGTETINRIQNKYGDYSWQAYVDDYAKSISAHKRMKSTAKKKQEPER